MIPAEHYRTNTILEKVLWLRHSRDFVTFRVISCGFVDRFFLGIKMIHELTRNIRAAEYSEIAQIDFNLTQYPKHTPIVRSH